jgi:putative ABC transport system permease protein
LSAVRTLTQIAEVTVMNLRAVPQRAGASAVAVVGIAGVVLIIVAVLSVAQGFRRTLELAGSDRVAIVLRGNSTAEMESLFSEEQVQIIEGTPGIVRGPGGPIVSAELFTSADQPKRSTGTAANAPLRGIEPEGPLTREHFRLIAGRMFRTGHYEVIVGRQAVHTLSGLEVGSTAHWGNIDWQVVGEFADGGSVAESEIWTDARVLQGAYSRGDSFQTVRALLPSAASFAAFKHELARDPRLDVSVYTEREFYAEQARMIAAVVRGAGTVLALLMGVGAVFGALNTMYSAVAARTTEIATLRALGFGASAIVLSVVTEGLLLALIGGALGAAGAYLAFNGFETSTLNYSSFSQVSFAFAVTPALIAGGIGYALLLGFIGGVFPAIHAARLPIIEGLREA